MTIEVSLTWEGALPLLLNKLSEEDFMVLRGPLESGRQSPGSLSGVLVLSLFLQPIMFFVTYVVAADSTMFPNKDIMFTIHLWITAIIMLISIIYAIPTVYRKSQKIQYLISIVVSQNLFGVFLYLSALFLIGGEGEVSEKSLLNFTYVTLLFGLLIFIATSIRFYILLHKGHYRKGSKKDELRERFETKSHLPMVIIGSTGLVYIIQFLVRTLEIDDFNMMIVIVLGPLLFFTMIFVLPEQLVILYCKFRFDSFNYSEKGKLKPFNKHQKGAKK